MKIAEKPIERKRIKRKAGGESWKKKPKMKSKAKAMAAANWRKWKPLKEASPSAKEMAKSEEGETIVFSWKRQWNIGGGGVMK